MVAAPPAKKRGSYKSSERVRTKLLDAAMVEFSDNGFEGASTRAIAQRADAHQPQINYHFDSKEALWYAVMDRLMDELDDAMPEARQQPKESMENLIRGLVRFVAARPELNRIMIQEASASSERLTWLVDTHIRPRFVAFQTSWNRLREAGHGRDIPAELVYHLMIGAASLLHANAPEVELVVGIRPSDPSTVEAHADAMVQLFIGD
jgi:TetR/AcrR family transcriptional regulator